ncbi:UNVERIFIED_CONTAM: hypothetical protein Slati_1317600 [Sesamum latifolium]|uniref:Uncharacterized protein n=1 Tax=Sesamum latifolium TaxID=2727402 RepID=A0AAW2XI99_9LAMI
MDIPIQIRAERAEADLTGNSSSKTVRNQRWISPYRSELKEQRQTLRATVRRKR